MAFGAQQRDVLSLVLGQGMILAFFGVVIGLAAALATTRLVSSLLFAVTATDPLTFSAISTLLIGVAAAAGYVPARRAVKIDPLQALTGNHDR